MLRRVLLDWPVRLFNLWWTIYGIALALVIMIVVTVLALELVLRAFGIRWGW